MICRRSSPFQFMEPRQLHAQYPDLTINYGDGNGAVLDVSKHDEPVDKEKESNYQVLVDVSC